MFEAVVRMVFAALLIVVSITYAAVVLVLCKELNIESELISRAQIFVGIAIVVNALSAAILLSMNRRG